MKQNLQNKLFKKYPSLFQYRQEKRRYPIILGIECGGGWYKIIEEACEQLDFIDYYDSIRIAQIKEKFGLLRICIHANRGNIEGIVRCAECKSSKVCEYCGSKLLVKRRSPFGYVHTMCLKCLILYIIKEILEILFG